MKEGGVGGKRREKDRKSTGDTYPKEDRQNIAGRSKDRSEKENFSGQGKRSRGEGETIWQAGENKNSRGQVSRSQT